jgi:hypothetical protein
MNHFVIARNLIMEFMQNNLKSHLNYKKEITSFEDCQRKLVKTVFFILSPILQNPLISAPDNFSIKNPLPIHKLNLFGNRRK